MHHVFATADFDRVRARESLKDLNCLGFLHTHILADASPSKGDIRGYPTGTLIFIYSDIYPEFRAFRIMNGRPGYVEKNVRVTS